MMEYPTQQERWIPGRIYDLLPGEMMRPMTNRESLDALRQWYADRLKAKTHVEHCMGVAYVVWDEAPSRRVEIKRALAEMAREAQDMGLYE